MIHIYKRCITAFEGANFRSKMGSNPIEDDRSRPATDLRMVTPGEPLDAFGSCLKKESELPKK
jgi:hypothetical protein